MMNKGNSRLDCLENAIMQQTTSNTRLEAAITNLIINLTPLVQLTELLMQLPLLSLPKPDGPSWLLLLQPLTVIT